LTSHPFGQPAAADGSCGLPSAVVRRWPVEAVAYPGRRTTLFQRAADSGHTAKRGKNNVENGRQVQQPELPRVTGADAPIIRHARRDGRTRI
jgi:hypothetical protein